MFYSNELCGTGMKDKLQSLFCWCGTQRPAKFPLTSIVLFKGQPDSVCCDIVVYMTLGPENILFAPCSVKFEMAQCQHEGAFPGSVLC